jgi:hypothetical protein
LTRSSFRPRAGAIAFAIAAAADLLDGRVTFAVGVAVGAWALVALRSRRLAWSAVLSVACYATSPLAGLFLGIVLVSVLIADPSRRRTAALPAAALLTAGAGMAITFPGTGTMPFTFGDAIPSGLCCLAVLALCQNKVIGWTAGIVLLCYPVLLVSPWAVGENITRFGWLCAAPIVVSYARLPRPVLILSVCALAVWPCADLIGQLTTSENQSAQGRYYAPLNLQLSREFAATGATAVGARVELVDTKNHWGSAYLFDRSLARGWDRQADVANNPIFYRTDALTADSYHAWLDELAVAWVAVPSAPLDYASVNEARLIRSDLRYLKLQWSSPNWKLYRVVDPTPLVSGARVTEVSNTGVVLAGPRAKPITVRVRWSPYLAVHDASGNVTPACISDVNGWVGLVLPQSETITLSGQFDPARRLATKDPDCVSDLLTG